MKKTNTRKLALAGVFCAVAVVGSLLSFPVLGSKCSPVQHMVNILCAVLLGVLCAFLFGVNPLITSLFPMEYDKMGRVALVAGVIDCFIYIGSALAGSAADLDTGQSDLAKNIRERILFRISEHQTLHAVNHKYAFSYSHFLPPDKHCSRFSV